MTGIVTDADVRRIVNERAHQISDIITASVGKAMEKDGERLAILEVEIKHLREDQARQNYVLEEMRKELRTISTTMSEARGGWRVIALIGGISGTIGAALTKLLPILLGVPK